MKVIKIIGCGIAGTSLMTAFSYAVSNYQGQKFKEPELLAELLSEALPGKQLALPAGWLTHYTAGISWATLFELLFEKAGVRRDVKNSLLLGSFSGLTAIAIWDIAFHLPANPPKISLRRFYGHLFLAHLVYTSALTATNKMIK